MHTLCNQPLLPRPPTFTPHKLSEPLIHRCNIIATGVIFDYCLIDCLTLQDAHRQRTVNWVDSTGGTNAAFDFTTKGILQEALGRSELWRLVDAQVRGMAAMVVFNSTSRLLGTTAASSEVYPASVQQMWNLLVHLWLMSGDSCAMLDMCVGPFSLVPQRGHLALVCDLYPAQCLWPLRSMMHARRWWYLLCF